MKGVLSFVLLIGLVMALPALAQWEPDVRLTYNDSSSITSLNNAWCVAASGSNVHVVWSDRRDLNYEIYTKRSTDSGLSWELDTRLTNNDSSSYNPSVAVSGSNVHVVWHDRSDGNYEIYTKCSTNYGVSWGADTRLTNNSGGSWYPSVAVSGSNLHVVWYDNRGSRNPEIYYKRSTDSGVSWETDTRLTYDGAESNSPSVAVSGSNVHVVWQDYRDGNDEIYTKRSTDSGTAWGMDTRLTSDSLISYIPSVAVSGSMVHVVWVDGRGGNYEIYYKRNPTGNIGIEEGKGFEGPRGPGVQRFKVTPNPFTSFATLPGHEGEWFSLYDVSGRQVGIFRGDRVGEGLGPGVYFLRSSDGKDKPLRIVKVR